MGESHSYYPPTGEGPGYVIRITGDVKEPKDIDKDALVRAFIIAAADQLIAETTAKLSGLPKITRNRAAIRALTDELDALRVLRDRFL